MGEGVRVSLEVRLAGEAPEQLGGLTLWRSAGTLRLELATAGAPLMLAHGAYQLRCIVLMQEGAAEAVTFRAGSESFVLARIGDTWSADILLPRAADACALEIAGAGAFVVAGTELSTQARPPSITEAGLALARAGFAKAPAFIRAPIIRLSRRQETLQRMRRKAREGDEAPAPGRVLSGAALEEELTERRLDFETRMDRARAPQPPDAPLPPRLTEPRAKAIAFHLPQYHRIAENDAWWGAGFTDWTNVAKAQPQFLGHAQPRMPGELGYYDLTAPGALARQAALAAAYGLSAFCFHYYWFAGKRLLEAPVDAFVADSTIDLGFCLCWANENWTRRWDGAEDDVLIAQNHSREDNARVFDDIARYAEDARYLRIDGKPLILIYRPDIIPDARALTDIWRERAVARGWPGVFLAATTAFGFQDAASLGFDALVEFPPHNMALARWSKPLAWLNGGHRGDVFDYPAIAASEAARLTRVRADAARFAGVMPGWDNEARRPGRGAIYHGATPETYAAWLDAAISYAERSAPDRDRRLVFINAWNEWAEGAYLEPDRTWGRALLEATRGVLE